MKQSKRDSVIRQIYLKLCPKGGSGGDNMGYEEKPRVGLIMRNFKIPFHFVVQGGTQQITGHRL